MCLATGFIVEGVEDAKGRRAELQREPRDGARLGVGQRQRAGEKVGHCGLLAGLGFETDEQCELDHGLFLSVNG